MYTRYPEVVQKVAGVARLGRIAGSINRKAVAGAPIPPGLVDAAAAAATKLSRRHSRASRFAVAKDLQRLSLKLRTAASGR